MANEKQFAIRDVLSCAITDYTNGNALAYIGYATQTSVSTESDRLDIRGGAGNFVLGGWDHSKKTSIQLSLPITDLNLLNHIWSGASTVITPAAQTAHKDEVLVTSGATPTITLTATPTSGTLKVYLMNSEWDLSTVQTTGTPSTTVNKYSLDGVTITLNSTTAPAGTRILAMYDYTTAATASLLAIKADMFPDFVRITGNGLWTNVVTGDDEVVSFDFKKAKIKPNVTITEKATEATVMELSADLYYVASGSDKIYANIVKV
jgi:hypothetical protein